MNILIPDSWLREYLETDATPKQIKTCLSLCGPSVERVTSVNGETIYDIEVTGNRTDAMSVMGIAREASVILPRFGIPAKLLHDPYKKKNVFHESKGPLTLSITADETLCPRFAAVVFDHVTIKPSRKEIQKKLELVGVRPLNNVIDITNYILHLMGQPVHTFDYDTIKDHIMTLRAAKSGETVQSLDGKIHTLPGGDITMEDGSGSLIDLCGIMGGYSTRITEKTKRVILFIQNYDSPHVRKTCMALSHRTEASGLFEKGIDPELVTSAMREGIALMERETGGVIRSPFYDLYPHPYEKKTISLSRSKLDRYMGTHLDNETIQQTLEPLGFDTTVSESEITAGIPSFRRDVSLDVDIIEEIARIWGYHELTTKLPDTEPPITYIDPTLTWEERVKTRMRDWGYTETYTYSMISGSLMETFGFDRKKTYTITNPLSDEWVYMRPSLLPSVLTAIRQNLSYEKSLALFELSNIYLYRENDLPHERPTLIVAVTSEKYRELKGLSEALFDLFGIPFPEGKTPGSPYFDREKSLQLDEYGIVGVIEETLLTDLGISVPVTVLELDIEKCIAHASEKKTYRKIPKYPPSFEDIALTVTEKVRIGDVITAIKTIDPLISDVTLLDTYKNTKTLHITYQSTEKNLTADDIRPIREKILKLAAKKGAELKK